MAGETLSASLPVLVDDMRKKSVTKSLAMGVTKGLVKVFDVNGFNSISEPIWDATTGGSATTKTEATDYTEFASYKNTSWTISPTKRVFGTKLTDEDGWYASESIRSAHAEKHAYAHAKALEIALVGTFASYSNSITATSASGLTVAKVMDAVALLEATAYTMERPYSLVTNAFGYKYLAKDMAQQGVSSNYGPVGPLADKVLNKYFVGNVMGAVNVFQTMTPALAASSAAVGGLFAKEATGLAVWKWYEFATDRDESAGVTELISRSVFGARVHFADYGVKVTHKANA